MSSSHIYPIYFLLFIYDFITEVGSKLNHFFSFQEKQSHNIFSTLKRQVLTHNQNHLMDMTILIVAKKPTQDDYSF